MSNTTMESWQQNIGIRLASNVPTILLSDGITLAANYLSLTGGWNPDNPAIPTGLGVPVSGLSDDAVVALILSQIASAQYEFTATITLPITVTVYTNLTPGLNSTQVRDSVGEQVRDYIDRLFTDLPIGINTGSLPYASYDSTSVGATTPTKRVSYNTGIGTTVPNIMSNALEQSREMFTLDDSWNIASIYVSDTSLTAILRKYLDTSYAVNDPAVTDRVVVGVDPDHGRVISGIKVAAI